MTKRKGQKDKQRNDQKKSNTMTEEQATQWPKEKEQKNKQHNGQKKGNRK